MSPADELLPLSHSPHARPPGRLLRRWTGAFAVALLLVLGWAALVRPSHDGIDAAQSLGIWSMMSSILGWVEVECAPYTVLEVGKGFEVREYPPGVAIEAVMTGAQSEEPFRLLAQYIGVFGAAANEKAQGIAMTAPVVTQGSEQVAMTAPVLTATADADAGGSMQFILPAKFHSVRDAPKPTDTRVHLVGLPKRRLAVQQFTGFTSAADASERAAKVSDLVEALGYSVERGADGAPRVMLARYNPPWTLPWLRRNEVQVLLADQVGEKTGQKPAEKGKAKRK